MKTTGAPVLMSAMVLALLGGCAAEAPWSQGAPIYMNISQPTVENTFTLLTRMKAEELVTAQQYEDLRLVLVENLGQGLPGGIDQDKFYSYLSRKCDSLLTLRSLQRQGKLTQPEFEKLREGVLNLQMTHPASRS